MVWRISPNSIAQHAASSHSCRIASFPEGIPHDREVGVLVGVVLEQFPPVAEVFGLKRRCGRPECPGQVLGAGRAGIRRNQPAEQAGHMPGQERGIVGDRQIGPEGAGGLAEGVKRLRQGGA